MSSYRDFYVKSNVFRAKYTLWDHSKIHNILIVDSSCGFRKTFCNEIPCNMYDVIFSSFINHLTKSFYEVAFTYMLQAKMSREIFYIFNLEQNETFTNISWKCWKDVWNNQVVKLHRIFGYTAVVELYDGRTQTLASFLSWNFFSHSRFAKRGVTDPREDKKFWFLWLDTF